MMYTEVAEYLSVGNVIAEGVVVATHAPYGEKVVRVRVSEGGKRDTVEFQRGDEVGVHGHYSPYDPMYNMLRFVADAIDEAMGNSKFYKEWAHNCHAGTVKEYMSDVAMLRMIMVATPADESMMYRCFLTAYSFDVMEDYD